MALQLEELIAQSLRKAQYEYDDSVRSWCAWIKGTPGIYAQGKTVESTREELTAVLEDYFLTKIREGRKIPGLTLARREYAKTR